MATADIKREFERGGALQTLIMQFIHALMIQTGQLSSGNRLHTNEERLSRWLLMCRDRSETNALNLTQEFPAIMLGANRATAVRADTAKRRIYRTRARTYHH